MDEALIGHRSDARRPARRTRIPSPPRRRVLAVVLLVGCSESAFGPPGGPGADEFPFGATFESDLDVSDISIPDLAGHWTFHFQGSLVGFVAHEGVDQITVHYDVVGDEIEIMDVAGDDRCRGDAQSGRYRWTLADETLEFEVIEDACARRIELLTTDSWTRT